MVELIRTTDPVVLSLARSVLEEAGILAIVMDSHMSGIEGSIGIFPRRLMVVQSEADEARRVLAEADLAAWLVGS